METLIIILGITVLGIIALKKFSPSKYEQIKYNLKDISYISIISMLALYCYFNSIGNIVFIGLMYLFASSFRIINIFNKT